MAAESSTHVKAAIATEPVLARPERRFWQAEWVLFLLFIFPNFLLFGVFTYWPMIQNAYLSTVRWDMVAPRKLFVGVRNYEYLLTSDDFRQVLLNTLVFTVATVGLALIIGLAAALLLNQPLRGRDGARAVLFAPTLLSGAAIGIVWVYMFDPRYGLVAQVLGWVGLTSPNWLVDSRWAMPAVIIVYIWKNLGFTAVIYLAGLQSIPRDLYEAAKIDGAGPLWQFRSVTLPMLSPITFFLVITSILSTFQAFDIIRVMTAGGPANATNTLIYYIYEQGFVAFNAGRAAAAAMVLFVVMFAITFVQLRFTEQKVHYE